MKKTTPFLSILLSMIITFFLLSCFSFIARAVEPNHGYVIVQPDPNQRWIREIQFSSSINGLEALQLAQQVVITANTPYGVAVCSIAGVGCPATDCFCSSSYWAYSYWDGSAWQDYGVGPSGSSLGDGAIEGWRWGKWGSTGIPAATHLIAANEALDYLLTIQNTDGGYTGTSSSVETLISIGSNNILASDWSKPGNPASLEDYWLLNSVSYSDDGAAEAGKLAVGSVSASFNPPVGTLTPANYYNANTGIYAEGAGYQSWAMLGAYALGETIPSQAVVYLKSLQKSDGGFEWYPGLGSDTNSTSLAIQALLASGESIISSEVFRGLNYLKSAQNNDGGFPYDPVSPWGTASDTNSTAYAIQAILAANQDPEAAPWVKPGGNPYDFLLSTRLPNGSLEWQIGYGSNVLATQQAIPALMHIAFAQAINNQVLSTYLPVIMSTGSK
ncbi:MAG: hypothetical protein GYA34_11445 [Chloroflexi bacterium]|nr:hypothetical protein [Chloroflexota bacterium]